MFCQNFGFLAHANSTAVVYSRFVVGNGPPPPTNSHASLYRTPQPNQPLVPHPQAHVFGAGFLSARDIEKFMARYPSTEFPPLSENDIPSTPEYAQLRRFIDAHKRGAEGNPEEADDGEWVFFAAGDDDEVMMGQLEDLAL